MKMALLLLPKMKMTLLVLLKRKMALLLQPKMKPNGLSNICVLLVFIFYKHCVFE